MINDKYIILFGNCFPVKGANRSIICDLQRGSIFFITNDFYHILEDDKDYTLNNIFEKYGNSNIDTIKSYIDFLVKNNLGFVGDNLIKNI